MNTVIILILSVLYIMKTILAKEKKNILLDKKLSHIYFFNLNN